MKDFAQDGHFFASNAVEWVTEKTLLGVVSKLENFNQQSSYPMKVFNVYFVPHSLTKHYKIVNYAPLDVDAEFVGEFFHTRKKKNRVRRAS